MAEWRALWFCGCRRVAVNIPLTSQPWVGGFAAGVWPPLSLRGRSLGLSGLAGLWVLSQAPTPVRGRGTPVHTCVHLSVCTQAANQCVHFQEKLVSVSLPLAVPNPPGFLLGSGEERGAAGTQKARTTLLHWFCPQRVFSLLRFLQSTREVQMVFDWAKDPHSQLYLSPG